MSAKLPDSYASRGPCRFRGHSMRFMSSVTICKARNWSNTWQGWAGVVGTAPTGAGFAGAAGTGAEPCKHLHILLGKDLRLKQGIP